MIQAIPFIISENNQFKINKEASDFISSIKDKKVTIVSVVGKYRTGKSYLINRVFFNNQIQVKLQNQGFNMGSTINACTKGIWIYPELIPNPQDPDHFNLILDTEGFSGLDQTLNHDGKINLLSLILSEIFLYNNFGQLDEYFFNQRPAIQNLSLVISLAYELNKKYKDNQKKNPELLWIIRDFALQMVNNAGTQIDPIQYLENSIQWIPGSSEIIDQKNKCREKIRSFFQSRDIQTIVRPIESEQKLQNIINLDDSQIRKEFLQDIQKLKSNIFKKSILNYQKQFNGTIFLALTEQYICALNQGEIPNIQHAMFYVSKNECLKAITHCLNLVDKFLSNQKFSLLQFQKKKGEVLDEVERVFKSMAIGLQQDTRQYYIQMIDRINEKLDFYQSQCIKQNQIQQLEILEELNKEIFTLIENVKQLDFQTFYNKLNNIILQQKYEKLEENQINNAKTETLKRFCIQIELEKQHLDQKNKKLSNELLQLDQENKKIQITQKSSENEILSQQKIIINLKDEIFQINQQYQETQKQNNQFQLQINEVKLEKINFNNQIQELKGDNKKLSKSIQQLQEQNQNSKQEVYDMDQIHTKLKQQNNELSLEANLFKNQKNHVESEINNYQIQLKKQQEVTQALQSKLNEKTDSVKKLKHIITDLNQEINRNQNKQNEKQQFSLEQRDSLCQQIQNLNAKIDEYSLQIQKIQSENKKLIQDQGDQCQENQELKFQIKQFQHQLDSQEKEKVQQQKNQNLIQNDIQKNIQSKEKIQKILEEELKQKDQKIQKQEEAYLLLKENIRQIQDQYQSQTNKYDELQGEQRNLIYINKVKNQLESQNQT